MFIINIPRLSTSKTPYPEIISTKTYFKLYMGYTLIWDDTQIEDASDDFSYHVARNLEDALEEKENQIKWSNNMADLRKRFQDIISLKSLTVAEIRFSSMSSEYRALCIVVPEEQTLFYWSTVPKKGSHQQRQLELMRENSDRISQIVQRKLSQRSS